MTTVQDIYSLAVSYINNFLKDEFKDQGHHLSGAYEQSMDGLISATNENNINLDGFALYYGTFVNEGVPAQHASMKQFPFVVRYFIQRGLSEKEARGAAAATIHKWMKEGMSTAASKHFSKTGQRQQFIEDAFTKNDKKLDSFMGTQYDNMVNELFQLEKNETI
jgi:hypothetical protein